VSAINKILKPKTCKYLFLIQQWMKDFPAPYSGMYTIHLLLENSRCKQPAHSVYKCGRVFMNVITPMCARDEACVQKVDKEDILKFNDC
jgi:hypothetical protein